MVRICSRRNLESTTAKAVERSPVRNVSMCSFKLGEVFHIPSVPVAGFFTSEEKRSFTLSPKS